MSVTHVDPCEFGSCEFDPSRRYYPQDFAQRYVKAGYWTDDTLAQLYPSSAAAHGDHEAVVGHDVTGTWERVSYRQQHERNLTVASRLRALGIGRGDRVIVQLPNVTEYVSCVFALFYLGAIPVFALPAHRQAELTQFVAQTQAKALICPLRFAGTDFQALAATVREHHPSLLVIGVGDAAGLSEPTVWLDTKADASITAEEAAVDVDPQQLAFLQLSGGTTGTPKLIPRTHADYLYSVRESARICGLDTNSRMLVVLPASHNFTMSSPGILGAIWAGATLVFAREPSASTGFSLIESERITITALVPPLAMAWLAAKPKIDADISSLEVLQVGGAKFNEEAARRIRPEFGCMLQQVFGMAEGLVNYTRFDDPEELIVGTQGRPISPSDEVLILDDAGNPVPAGARGHLFTRGPYTIRGYLGGVDAGSFTADGFYRTGDIVRQLPSGHLVVEGRDKDQINRSGEKISAEEIENHLLAYPGVIDAAVVAVPDDVLGERSCAFVLFERPPKGGERTTELFQALRAFLRERGLAAYKLPDEAKFPAQFPTTGVGKISRKELRRRLRATITESATAR